MSPFSSSLSNAMLTVQFYSFQNITLQCITLHSQYDPMPYFQKLRHFLFSFRCNKIPISILFCFPCSNFTHTQLLALITVHEKAPYPFTTPLLLPTSSPYRPASSTKYALSPRYNRLLLSNSFTLFHNFRTACLLPLMHSRMYTPFQRHFFISLNYSLLYHSHSVFSDHLNTLLSLNATLLSNTIIC